VTEKFDGLVDGDVTLDERIALTAFTNSVYDFFYLDTTKSGKAAFLRNFRELKKSDAEFDDGLIDRIINALDSQRRPTNLDNGITAFHLAKIYNEWLDDHIRIVKDTK
jgi:hypothetical protein